MFFHPFVILKVLSVVYLGQNFHGSVSVNMPITLSLNILILQVVLVNNIAFRRTLKIVEKTAEGCVHGQLFRASRLSTEAICKAILYYLKVQCQKSIVR